MKALYTDIKVGIHYELPDGSIAYAYGVHGWEAMVVYYFDDDHGQRYASFDEVKTWKARVDLRDFPNARDPRLPYEFDLHWDLKFVSQLRQAIKNNHDDLDAIRQAMADHSVAV
jgi:hypothetical protein